MAFSELKDNVDEIHEETKAYIESTVTYYKLWSFKVAMKSTTLIFKFVLITVCVIMMLLFASIAASFAIGSALESTALGFLIVAGVYLILFIVFLFIKPQIIEGSILKRFSEIFFNE